MLNGLSIYLQAQNLTNEPFVTVESGTLNPLRIIDYQRYGRRWMLGATLQVRRRCSASAASAAMPRRRRLRRRRRRRPARTDR